jgi:hypothetical protein
MLDVDTGTAHHVGGIPAEGSEMQRRYSEISESGCVFGCGSGLGSGSGWVAVRGLDGACDCGHFEWSHAHVWMKFG